MAFAHLHLHTEYSLLDGACRIKPLVQRLKALGMTACAVTDHGVMYGAVDFYSECLAAGIKPIIGCEMYVCPDMDDKQGISREYSHLILLCENQTGYRNLTRLVSAGFTRGFYYRPRVDYALLEKHAEGLICLSACLSGDLPKYLLQGRQDDARAYVNRMRGIFGENGFFVEVMDHGIADEVRVRPRLIALAREMDVPLVVTNDCHYLEQKDAPAQEVLMCIQTGKTLDDPQRMRMETEQLYVKSEQEMRGLFPECPDAIDRTAEIAARCEVAFDFKTRHLPRYPVPEGETASQMLRRLCAEGLRARYPASAEGGAGGGAAVGAPEARLEYEISMIERMGFVDYFLIVWDFIHYAKEHGIMVGPGRGSGAGSIVAYTLDITALDPLRYNLLFERFLNPERLSMPDLDIDFCYERRQEVIDYVARKYGQDHVAQIITFGTMAARGVLRDVGRVLGMTYAQVDQIAKMVPFDPNMTLERALSLSPQLKEAYDSDETVRRLIDTAMTLEGMPRHASTHAAGVLITSQPVTDYVPLQKNDDVVTTQYPMGTIERLGLLKMDFLGLRTLTVIRDALEMMGEAGVHMKPADIPLDDAAVYRMISAGDTDGVFQLEGTGMRNFLTAMKPACFEDIIAAISLYRPGPMESIPRYIAGKQDPATVTYATPLLKPILDVTYGCMVYQEQVMQIVRDLAGYSLGRSDLMRRAMAKKKKDVMAQEREYFVHGMTDERGAVVIPGAVRNGVPEAAAEHLYDDMSAFASYAFNKSHAAAYAVVAVQTGWLKRHYPVAFMAALMNSVVGNAPKIAAYVQYCRAHDIPVLAPDVNESAWRFRAGRDAGGRQGIRFGLGAVKNVGAGAVEAIVQARAEAPFRDIFDFCDRVPPAAINKRAVESLIMAGAFDALPHNRAQLMAVYERALDEVAQTRRQNVAGQLSLFDLALGGDALGLSRHHDVPDLQEHPRRAILSMEKDMTGVYISGHPLQEYAARLAGYTQIAAVLAYPEEENHGIAHDGESVRMAGILISTRGKATKKGAMMGFVVLEDLTGQIEGLVFPRVWERVGLQFPADSLVEIAGKLSIREEEDPKLLVDSIRGLEKEKDGGDAGFEGAGASSMEMPEEMAEDAGDAAEDAGFAAEGGDSVSMSGDAQPAPPAPRSPAPIPTPASVSLNPTLTDAQRAAASPAKLYLKTTRPQLKAVSAVLSVAAGGTPVYARLADEGIAILFPAAQWCEPTPALLASLKRLLGEDAVVLREAKR